MGDPQAQATQTPPAQAPDSAEQILRSTQGLDDNVRADAWDAYHNSANEDELAGKLQNMNLPQDVKANLWDAKHSAKPSQPVQQPTQQPTQQADVHGGAGYQVIGDALKKAFLGQDTALAQGATPNQQIETSGLNNLVHGNIREGFGKMWEANAPHIIPGSPMEKLIQEFKPDFHGTADQAYQTAHPTLSSVGDHPVVDAAQFIDKKEHPILKALTEAGQSMTSPNNIAILAGTGGMGLIESPKALAITNKLLSAGFSAQAIGGLYKNSKAFVEAYENGDPNEALYQMTHALANGTMAFVAGSHAVGKEMPFASDRDINAAKRVGNAVTGITGKTADLANRAANSIAGTFGISNDFNTVVKNISKPSAKAYQEYKSQIANTSEDLQAILNNNPDVKDPKDFANAIDSHIQNHEQMLQQESGVTQDSNAPVAHNLTADLTARLDKFFADNKGQFPEDAVADAKRKLLERVLVSRNGEHLQDPNLFEAENVRRGLNDESAPGLGVKRNAYQAGALEVANELRDKIDDAYDKRGVKNVQEWRGKEADLIDIRDQIEKAQKKAEEGGEPSLWKSITDKVGLPSAVLAAVFGFAHPAGATAAGLGILSHYLTEKGANPISNVQRAAKIASENQGARAVEPERVPTANPNPNASGTPPVPAAGSIPTNHALYGDLATHYGETLGATPYDDLHGRFLVDLADKMRQGIPLQPAERTLLGKVNQHYATQQTMMEEAATKAAEEEKINKEAADKEKAEAGLIPSTKPPFATQDHIPVPARFAEMGFTPARVGAHELGHQIMVDEHGHGTGDIINHLHDAIDSGSLAEARWEKPNFMDEDGKVKVDKIPEILEILHGGVIAEELLHNVPVHENPADDLEIARRIVKDAGFGPAETGMIMKAAELKAREVFNTPGVTDIIKRYTEHREAGLDKGTHMSGETVGKAVQEVRQARGRNGTTNNEAQAGKEGKANAGGDEAGGKGATEGKPKEAVRPSGEERAEPGKGTEPRTNLKPGAGTATADREENTGEGATTSHERTDFGGIVHLHEGDKVTGRLKYGLQGDTANLLGIEAPKGKGYGQKLLDEGMNQARERGAKTMEAGTKNTLSMDAAKMLDRAAERGVPVQKTEGKIPGSPAYQIDLNRPAATEFRTNLKPGEWIPPAGLEKGIPKDEAVNTEIPLENLSVSEHQYNQAASNYFRGKGSKSEGPVNIVYNPDNGQYLVEDGMHRIVKAHQEGRETIPAKVWSGYSDTANVLPEHKMDMSKIEEEEEPTLKTNLKPNLKPMPNERTTGKPEDDTAIRAGGGVPGGAMFTGADQIRMFHDPESGTTLGFRAHEAITPEAVQAKLAASRAEYAAAERQNSGAKGEPIEWKTNLRPDRVSTRVPTAKATKTFTPEEHMGEEPLTIGREAVDKDPRIQQKLADVVKKYPGFKFPEGLKDPAKILDRFTTQVKDNLLHLWDSVAPEKRTANAKWYESVNKKANADAGEHGIQPRQAAGVYASLSPQKDWDMNASLAKRVMDTHFNHANDVGSPKMTDFGQGLVDKARADAENKMAAFKASGEKDPVIVQRKQGAYERKLKNAADLEAVVKKISGQKYSDLTDPYEKGVWVRLHDEVNNPRNYPKIDPGTGNPLEDVTNADGSKSKVAWGSMEPIARAVSILQDGSRENISEQLGGEHKVRNFYNNIIDPTHPEDVTIDTHAVAAGHMQPFSGQSKEVTNNFGSAGKSAQTGVHGSYPLYAEGYRQAAQARGVKAREMQSVTWEKIRELFPAEIKDADFQKQTQKIMKKVSDGKISIQEARKQVTNAAVDKRIGQMAGKVKQTLDNSPKVRDNISAGAAALGGE